MQSNVSRNELQYPLVTDRYPQKRSEIEDSKMGLQVMLLADYELFE